MQQLSADTRVKLSTWQLASFTVLTWQALSYVYSH